MSTKREYGEFNFQFPVDKSLLAKCYLTPKLKGHSLPERWPRNVYLIRDSKCFTIADRPRMSMVRATVQSIQAKMSLNLFSVLNNHSIFELHSVSGSRILEARKCIMRSFSKRSPMRCIKLQNRFSSTYNISSNLPAKLHEVSFFTDISRDWSFHIINNFFFTVRFTLYKACRELQSEK